MHFKKELAPKKPMMITAHPDILEYYNIRGDDRQRLLDEAIEKGSFEIPVTNFLKDSTRVQNV